MSARPSANFFFSSLCTASQRLPARLASSSSNHRSSPMCTSGSAPHTLHSHSQLTPACVCRCHGFHASCGWVHYLLPTHLHEFYEIAAADVCHQSSHHAQQSSHRGCLTTGSMSKYQVRGIGQPGWGEGGLMGVQGGRVGKGKIHGTLVSAIGPNSCCPCTPSQTQLDWVSDID